MTLVLNSILLGAHFHMYEWLRVICCIALSKWPAYVSYSGPFQSEGPPELPVFLPPHVGHKLGPK